MDVLFAFYLGVVSSDAAARVGLTVWSVLKPGLRMFWAGATEALCPRPHIIRPLTVEETFFDDEPVAASGQAPESNEAAQAGSTNTEPSDAQELYDAESESAAASPIAAATPPSPHLRARRVSS